MRCAETADYVATGDLEVAINTAMLPIVIITSNNEKELPEVPGMKKKPSTSELLDWLKPLLNEAMTPEMLRERQASMSRRENRCTCPRAASCFSP